VNTLNSEIESIAFIIRILKSKVFKYLTIILIKEHIAIPEMKIVPSLLYGSSLTLFISFFFKEP